MTKLSMIKLVGIASVLLLIFYPAYAEQKPVIIKIATLAPDGSAWIESLKKIDMEVAEKTGNIVRFKLYPGGVLGDEKDMLRKMHIGQIQAAVLTSSGLSAIFSEMDVFQIPFLFRDHQEVDFVTGKMDAFFKKGFEDKGYAMLGWSEGGFVRLMSVIPVDSLEKLRKAKVWTWADSPMAAIIFEEAQVSGIPLSVPDVLVGLQTGLVDVVYAPPSGAIALQWFTKIKYITDVPLIYLVGSLVIKKSVFHQISPDHQAVLKDSFERNMDELKIVIRKENQEALEVMAKHGVKILKPSEEEIKKFKDLSDRAMQRIKGHSFSKKVREEIEGYLRAYRGGNTQ